MFIQIPNIKGTAQPNRCKQYVEFYTFLGSVIHKFQFLTKSSTSGIYLLLYISLILFNFFKSTLSARFITCSTINFGSTDLVTLLLKVCYYHPVNFFRFPFFYLVVRDLTRYPRYNVDVAGK